MPATLSLELKPSSPRVLTLFFLAHLLAGCAVLLSGLHWLIKLALIISILWHIFLLWKRQAQLPTQVVYRHQAKKPYKWVVKTSMDEWALAALSPRTRCWRCYILLVLRLRQDKRLLYLPILPGDMDAARFRQLSVLLRFYD